jgi:hypothetical protein
MDDRRLTAEQEKDSIFGLGGFRRLEESKDGIFERTAGRFKFRSVYFRAIAGIITRNLLLFC